jgi:thymidylate synthase (FAD)
VLAHAFYVFQVTGVSRSLSHELIRHSAGTSVSELSQRYVDCGDIGFVVPPAMMKYHDAFAKGRESTTTEDEFLAAGDFGYWLLSRKDELLEYEDWTDRLLADAPDELSATDKRKWARQAARNCLPNCAETWLTFGGNLRAWRNIIEQRCSRHADAEIRRLLNVIYDKLLAECPAVFSDYQKHQLPDGTFELTTPYTKV